MGDPKGEGDPPTEFPPEYLEGLRLFNSGYYWHAHESLEDIWNDSVGVDRDFYQGVIQVAAACFHIVRGNWSGATRLLHQAGGNLAPAGDRYRALDVAALQDALDALLDEVHRCQHEGKLVFDRALVPVLRLDGGPDVTQPLDGPPEHDDE